MSIQITLFDFFMQVDIFAMDLVLVPIHLGMHWCLAVRILIYCDSKTVSLRKALTA